MIDNTTKMEIANALSNEVSKQLKSGELLKALVGQNGVLHPNIEKEVWIGNYRFSIKIH